MFCTKCGNTLTEGARFCNKCGTPVEGAAPAPAAAAAPIPDAAGNPCVYDLNGVRGRHLTVFQDKVVFETAGGIMNNKGSNFFNENTFTWDTTAQSNEKMAEVANYCKKRIDECKSARNNPVAAAPAYSAADELIKFKSLLDAGVITQEEFDQKKKQI